jgi:hypothetical protein
LPGYLESARTSVDLIKEAYERSVGATG